MSHPDLQLSRIQRDKVDIQSLVMDTSWINPLSHDQTEFVSLSTATVAPPDVAECLIEAYSVEEAAYQLQGKTTGGKSTHCAVS